MFEDIGGLLGSVAHGVLQGFGGPVGGISRGILAHGRQGQQGQELVDTLFGQPGMISHANDLQAQLFANQRSQRGIDAQFALQNRRNDNAQGLAQLQHQLQLQRMAQQQQNQLGLIDARAGAAGPAIAPLNEIKHAQELVANHGELMGVAEIAGGLEGVYSEFGKEGFPGISNPQAVARIQSDTARLMFMMTKQFGQGALQQADRELMESIVGSGTGVMPDITGRQGQKLVALMKLAKARAATDATNLQQQVGPLLQSRPHLAKFFQPMFNRQPFNQQQPTLNLPQARGFGRTGGGGGF